VRFDVGGVDHLRIRGSSIAGKFAKQIFPDAAPRPTCEAIVYCRVRSVRFGTIAPAAAALQHVDNAADHSPIVFALDTSHIGRQVWFDPLPLLIAQPK
jgi:hypothetical protein